MKKYTWFLFSLLVACSTMVTGCEVIGGIFKAGVWTGTIIVILVIAIVIYIVSRLFGRNKN